MPSATWAKPRAVSASEWEQVRVGMLKPPPHVLRPSIARRVLSQRRTESVVWPGAPLRTPLRRRTLTVDSVLTPLREAGPRHAHEAVVFMHGNPGSGADFEPLVATGGARARAVAWDPPGFGHADKPDGFEQTVDRQAAFIGRALDELGIVRAHLVLHDFGGPWGLTVALSTSSTRSPPPRSGSILRRR